MRTNGKTTPDDDQAHGIFQFNDDADLLVNRPYSTYYMFPRMLPQWIPLPWDGDESAGYAETGTGDWISGPRDFERES